MEALLGLLQAEGVSIALIVVLFFIWREISRISKKVDGFNTRLYRSDGAPIYQNVKECDDQMHVCRNDINSLGMKVHQNTNDLIRADMRIAVLEATFNKIKGD